MKIIKMNSQHFQVAPTMIDILQRNKDLWELFARKEEYLSLIRDQFDRFPFYASSNRHIFEPLASQYLIENGYHAEYPDRKSFAVCLTHDIDVVYESIPSKSLSVFRHIRKGNLKDAYHSITRMHSKKVPFLNFSATMDLEEKYGAKSTFFFMAESQGEQDYTYNIEDIAPAISNICKRGWEVGLHGGHTAYNNAREMKEKKERLEKVTHEPVLGYRNHFLRFKVPDTWECLRKAGFQYDSTFGYADCAGFRNGMCHPFKPFNLNTHNEIEILEIPLVVMDDTLGQKYMRLDRRGKWELIKTLIDRVAACHGVFTLLWHNTYMEGENLELYEKILAYCFEKNAWLTSGDRIASQTISR